MADREKKKKRAYLDDFEKDLNGNYRYRGAHYRYAGEIPRGKALARLWALCGGGAALTVAAGVLPGATARAPLYLELPYMAALVLALYAVVVLVRATRGGDPMRAYIHEQTVQKLPSLCVASAVLCGVAAAGQGWHCLRMKDNCLAHTVFLYFLKSPPVPHLPPRRGWLKRCRGIEKNNYTLYKGVPCREAGHVFCVQRKGSPPPRGKLPAERTDEGRPCRDCPFTAQHRQTHPSSDLASPGHLPPRGKVQTNPSKIPIQISSKGTKVPRY